MIAHPDDDYDKTHGSKPPASGSGEPFYVMVDGQDSATNGPAPSAPAPAPPQQNYRSGNRSMTQELQFGGPVGPQGGAVTADDDVKRRREKLIGLLRGRLHWAIILAVVCGGGLGYLAYNNVDPFFRAIQLVRLENPRIIFDDDVPGLGSQQRWLGWVKEQTAIITGEDVASRALANENWLNQKGGAPDLSVSKFAKNITVDINQNNNADNVFGIGFDADDPATALAGCKAIMSAYRDVISALGKSKFDEMITRSRTLITKAEMEINNLVAIRRTVLPDGEVSRLPGDIQTYNDRQLSLTIALEEVRSQINSRNPSQGGTVKVSPAEMIQADPFMRQWHAEKEMLEQQIAVLKAEGKGPGHKTVSRLMNQRDVIMARIQERIAMLQGGEDSPLMGDPVFEELRQREQIYHAQLASVKATLEQLNERQAQIAGIEKEIELKENTIGRAREQIRRLEVEMPTTDARVREIGGPISPPDPYNAGSAKQMAVIGGVGGAISGFSLVMLIGLMDSRLRHAGDAKTGMPQARMLGILPTLPENFADPEQSEMASHAVHHIRTLMQISNGGTSRVFSITSPAAGSGKSSLSVALGLSFAASESRTLVIDCDLVGAGLTRRVGAVVNRSVESILREDTTLSDEQIDQAVQTANGRGINLKDALLELGMLTKKDLALLNRRQSDSALGVLDACHGRPFSECVATTGIDNFHVLPIGAAKPQDAGQLSPKAIRALISRARDEFDIVLIDTGPCLGSLEASMAAAEADATVLIVSRGDAKSMASRAYDHLLSVGANVLGVVFNHALDADLNHSSYASIVSQERRTDAAQSLAAADPAVAARFGPLGSAVAAFGTPSRSPNGKPRAATSGAGKN